MKHLHLVKKERSKPTFKELKKHFVSLLKRDTPPDQFFKYNNAKTWAVLSAPELRKKWAAYMEGVEVIQ